MTIPTRPAPAPPGSRAQNAAAGANASLEQLRLQLEQQQQQQQQRGNIQNLSIKLPPPPKGPTSFNQQQSQRNLNNNNNNNSSITRKFPQARYAPATNWDDDPFGATSTTTATTTNGNFKKIAPPRPPPPKVQVNARKWIAPTPPPIQSANILANIFNRKRVAKAAPRPSNGSRVYGVSSGNYKINNNQSSRSSVTTTTTATTTTTTTTTSATNNTAAASWNNVDWNSSIGYAAPSYAAATSTSSYSSYSSYTHTNNVIGTTLPSYSQSNSAAQELISFDSPPSSPTFTQKSNSDCVSVDSFSSDSNFSSPNNGSVSQPESGFEDDFNAARSRPSTTSPLDPWETNVCVFDGAGCDSTTTSAIGTAPVRNLNAAINTRNGIDNPLCNGKSLLPPPPTLSVPTIIKPKISQKPKAPKPPPTMYTDSRMQWQNGNANNDNFGANFYAQSHFATAAPHQAMPAPPTISLLDVISGKVDALSLAGASGDAYTEQASQPYGLALYDFGGVEEGDLCFKENEKIYILEQVSAEWYRGRTRAGCEGIFPVNYIDIKVPLVDDATSSSAAAAAVTTPKYLQQTMASSSMSKPSVRCLYNFDAEVEGDLLLKENDFVNILYKINDEWLYGEIDGRRGQFPANFLEYIPANLPLA